MRGVEEFTLTSTAGNLVFPQSTPMSHAKLVRDFVMGAWHRTIENVPKPKDNKNAQQLVQTHLNGPAKDAKFEWFKPVKR